MNGEDLGRTRLQTSLQPPGGSRGRGFSRSPSPAPGHERNRFEFPPNTAVNENDSTENFADANSSPSKMAPPDVEELKRIAETATQAAAAAAAALTAMTQQLEATTLANAQLRSVKKPDLPPFDPKNIEVWIRRVESAYTRAGVTAVKDKYAFLETKFPVDFNPRINQFLFGEITPEAWKNFLDYLRLEYGRTIEQRASTAIEGVRRDGRRPSQLAAAMSDLTTGVTLDDILKEHLFRELPVDVRRAIAKDAKGKSLSETAALADDYFGQDGRPLYTSPTSAINAVNPEPAPVRPSNNNMPVAEVIGNSSYTPTFNDADHDVNAVYRPSGRQQSQQARGPTRSSSRPTARSSSRPSGARGNNRKPDFDEKGHCYFHSQWGAKARSCKPGCKHPNAHSGNGSAGRQK